VELAFIDKRLAVLEVDERGYGGDGDVVDLVDVDREEVDVPAEEVTLHPLQSAHDLLGDLVLVLVCRGKIIKDNYITK
jgi:hypothetical protein